MPGVNITEFITGAKQALQDQGYDATLIDTFDWPSYGGRIEDIGLNPPWFQYSMYPAPPPAPQPNEAQKNRYRQAVNLFGSDFDTIRKNWNNNDLQGMIDWFVSWITPKIQQYLEVKDVKDQLDIDWNLKKSTETFHDYVMRYCKTKKELNPYADDISWTETMKPAVEKIYKAFINGNLDWFEGENNHLLAVTYYNAYTDDNVINNPEEVAFMIYDNLNDDNMEVGYTPSIYKSPEDIAFDSISDATWNGMRDMAIEYFKRNVEENFHATALEDADIQAINTAFENLKAGNLGPFLTLPGVSKATIQNAALASSATSIDGLLLGIIEQVVIIDKADYQKYVDAYTIQLHVQTLKDEWDDYLKSADTGSDANLCYSLGQACKTVMKKFVEHKKEFYGTDGYWDKAFEIFEETYEQEGSIGDYFADVGQVASGDETITETDLYKDVKDRVMGSDMFDMIKMIVIGAIGIVIIGVAGYLGYRFWLEPKMHEKKLERERDELLRRQSMNIPIQNGSGYADPNRTEAKPMLIRASEWVDSPTGIHKAPQPVQDYAVQTITPGDQ